MEEVVVDDSTPFVTSVFTSEFCGFLSHSVLSWSSLLPPFSRKLGFFSFITRGSFFGDDEDNVVIVELPLAGKAGGTFFCKFNIEIKLNNTNLLYITLIIQWL